MIRMFNARNMQLESDLVLVAGRAYLHWFSRLKRYVPNKVLKIVNKLNKLNKLLAKIKHV